MAERDERKADKEFLTKVLDLILEEGVTKQLNGECKGKIMAYLLILIVKWALIKILSKIENFHSICH